MSATTDKIAELELLVESLTDEGMENTPDYRAAVYALDVLYGDVIISDDDGDLVMLITDYDPRYANGTYTF